MEMETDFTTRRAFIGIPNECSLVQEKVYIGVVSPEGVFRIGFIGGGR